MRFNFFSTVTIFCFFTQAAFAYTNTGNNPGNNNAAGYNGGTSRSSSSSGTSHSGSTSTSSSSRSNTGNNPGNNNAAGYNGGSSRSSSSSGTSHSGSTSTSSSSRSNTGNNPGNNNASGYNGGGNRSSASMGGSSSSGGSSSMTRAEAQKYTSSTSTSGTRTTSPTMTRAQAQGYTSAMSSAGTPEGVRKANQAAVVSGFKNAEASYRGPAAATDLFSGTGHLNNYQRAFYNGVYQHYTRAGVDPTQQQVASGPLQDMLSVHGTNVTPSDVQVAKALDDGYRRGLVSISVPGKTFDGALLNDLAPAQRFALQNSVVVVGDGQFLMENVRLIGANGYSTGALFSTAATGGFVAVSQTSVNFTSRTRREALQDTLYHELDHAADNAIKAHSKAVLDGKVPGVTAQDLQLAEEAYALTSALTNRTLVSQIENVTIENGVVVTEDTARRIAAVNPDFLVKDEYYMRLNEIESYFSQPNAPVEDLAERLALTSNSGLTQQEAREIAHILSESPALGLVRDVTNSYAEQHLKP